MDEQLDNDTPISAILGVQEDTIITNMPTEAAAGSPARRNATAGEDISDGDAIMAFQVPNSNGVVYNEDAALAMNAMDATMEDLSGQNATYLDPMPNHVSRLMPP